MKLSILSALLSLVGLALCWLGVWLGKAHRHLDAALVWGLAAGFALGNLVIRVWRGNLWWSMFSVVLLAGIVACGLLNVLANRRWHQVRPTAYERRAQRGGGHG